MKAAVKRQKDGIKSKKKLKDLSAEEFFTHGLDSDISSEDEEDARESADLKLPKENGGQETSQSPGKSKHTSALLRLEDKDPEFYKFLKENDEELLAFDESDESSDDEQSGSTSDKAKDEKDQEEAVDNDEEMALADTEMESAADEFARDGEMVTLAILAKLKKGLMKNSLFSLRKVMRIFHDAVAEAADSEEHVSKGKLQYKVENSNVFNNLVQICLKSVSTVLHHHLASDKKGKSFKKAALPSTSKQWSKVKVTVKNYLMDLLQLLRQLAEPSMVAVVLRHVQDLSPYYACFAKIAKMLIKRLVRMWSSAEEHVRVLAFLCIRKMALHMPQLFDFIIKQLYLGFVKHAKFMSAKTKPLLAFMQNSLIEMFSMDHAITYQYGFIYIRQMAINLRNAITIRKKDSYQSVYNWQYISCIQLWARVLGELHSDTLAPLIYPLVQVILGVIRLIPTTRYYPLRFHCLHSLNMLSKTTNTYIPVASYLVEILESPEFNHKTKPSTAKASDVSYVLKFPKAHLHTRAFQDCIMDNICDLLLEHFVNHSTSIAFPELIFPVCLRMKRFMKKTEVPKFSKQIKQIVDKLQEAGHELSRKRSTANFSPKDVEEVKNWETAYAQQKNSLQKFCETWQKMREIAKANRVQDEPEDEERNSSDDEDEPRKKRKKKNESEKGSKTQVKDEAKTEVKNKKEKKPKTQVNIAQNVSQGLDAEDIVEDFELSSDDE
eukprot:Seg1996.3 transcript_id=Seg1996.3/GoldUCD/mRNA.D3Y31 product="Protein bud22" protein_id=Seg1996.3/GoldUCD/D3Y31